VSESSFGMAVSNGEGAGGAADENMIDISMKNTTGDHWTGRVKHTRRKDHVVSVNSSLYLSTAFLKRNVNTNLYVHAFFLQLQLNILLVRDMDGRPKFFNCALSEVGEDKVGS
jgi:hypothetical protein